LGGLKKGGPWRGWPGGEGGKGLAFGEGRTQWPCREICVPHPAVFGRGAGGAASSGRGAVQLARPNPSAGPMAKGALPGGGAGRGGFLPAKAGGRGGPVISCQTIGRWGVGGPLKLVPCVWRFPDFDLRGPPHPTLLPKGLGRGTGSGPRSFHTVKPCLWRATTPAGGTRLPDRVRGKKAGEWRSCHWGPTAGHTPGGIAADAASLRLGESGV